MMAERTQHPEKLPSNLVELIFDVAKTWGIFAAFTIVLVYQGHLREVALNKKVDDQQTFIQEQLLPSLNQTTAALNALNRSTQNNTQELKSTAEVIRSNK